MILCGCQQRKLTDITVAYNAWGAYVVRGSARQGMVDIDIGQKSKTIREKVPCKFSV